MTKTNLLNTLQTTVNTGRISIETMYRTLRRLAKRDVAGQRLTEEESAALHQFDCHRGQEWAKLRQIGEELHANSVKLHAQISAEVRTVIVAQLEKARQERGIEYRPEHIVEAERAEREAVKRMKAAAKEETGFLRGKTLEQWKSELNPDWWKTAK